MKKLLGVKLSSHWLFAIIAVFFGLIFLFNTPLLWGADETTHVGRVYQISEGHIFPEVVHEGYSNYGYGGTIPVNLKKVIDYVNHDFNVNTHQVIPGVKWVDIPSDYTKFSKLPLSGKQVQYNFSNTAVYSPVAYVPSIIAFKIAEILKLDIGPTIYLARFFDLAFYIFVITYVLRALRALKVKWIIFSVALIPMALYQASIITADTVTNALALSLVALVMKALFSKKSLNKLEYIITLLCAISLPIVKPSYLFISLLALLIPTEKVPLKHLKRITAPIVIIAGFLILAAWQYKTRYLSNTQKYILDGIVPWSAQINASDQIRYVVHHSSTVVGDFVRTIILDDNSYFDGLFGRLGFDYVQIPSIAVMASFIALIMSVGGSESFVRRNSRLILSTLAVLLISIAALFGTFYLTVSAPGMATIEGVQGRYFLPILPIIMLFVVITTKLRFNLSKVINYRNFTLTITGLVVFSLVLSAIKFHYITWG